MQHIDGNSPFKPCLARRLFEFVDILASVPQSKSSNCQKPFPAPFPSGSKSANLFQCPVHCTHAHTYMHSYMHVQVYTSQKCDSSIIDDLFQYTEQSRSNVSQHVWILNDIYGQIGMHVSFQLESKRKPCNRNTENSPSSYGIYILTKTKYKQLLLKLAVLTDVHGAGFTRTTMELSLALSLS